MFIILGGYIFASSYITVVHKYILFIVHSQFYKQNNLGEYTIWIKPSIKPYIWFKLKNILALQWCISYMKK